MKFETPSPNRAAREKPDCLVLGIGNCLLSDDGVGVHAVQALQRHPPIGAKLVDAGTAVLHALAFVEKASRVLVIDAVKGGHPPGTIYTLGLEQTQSTDWRFSLHSFGLREALRVLAPNVPPPPISVIGVEPLSLEYGLGLSAPVAAALPQVTALAHRIIADWRAGDRLVTAGADAETETLALT